MRVVLCCLAKNEHLYINDFVNWYAKLGFDKIYIYDNDDENVDNVENYIENKDIVEIINVRGVHEDRLQHKLYTKFYNEYKDTFDWCLFCDIDEYLFGVENIHSFLSQKKFSRTNQIRIKWKLFGDDDLITRDMSKPVYEIFSHEIKESWVRSLDKKCNLQNQGKAIVRGGLDNVVIESPHFASRGTRDNYLSSVLPSGSMCFSKVTIKEDYRGESVFLHHYMTKSLSEFIDQKLKRTDAVFGELSIDFNYYWRINKKTQEKLDYIKAKLGT